MRVDTRTAIPATRPAKQEYTGKISSIGRSEGRNPTKTKARDNLSWRWRKLPEDLGRESPLNTS